MDGLFSQLDAAENGLADGKIDATINQLGAFTNAVQAQRGKKITEAAADDLIAQAQVIIAILSATPTPELTSSPTLANTDTPLLTKIHQAKPVETSTPTFTEIPSPTLTLTPSLTPTESPTETMTFTPTNTFTPLPTATSIPPAGPLTINYTYDALHRLKKADYSNGRFFSYNYGANGNTLTAGTEASATNYTYDAASQLVTAQADTTIWHYVYDANGNLTEVLPNGNETNGAKRYSYNAAGYLVRVESHDGTAWSTQSEMTYNGLGTRMTTSASGVTSQYASDGQLPLAISSAGKTTTILYGNGPVAEQMDIWNYVLTDGVNVPRQLTDMNGAITLSARYSPWGSPIETDGVGNFNASYIGNLLDMNTGLIYVGNGQYYDPTTGRFLTRGVQPNSANPYMPWNPIGAIFAPFSLLAIYYSRKKGKHPLWVALIFMAVILAACECPVPNPFAPSNPPSTPPPTQTPPPTTTPHPPAPTPSPAPCPCTLKGKFIMSAYYIVGEDQYSDAGGHVPIPASANIKTNFYHMSVNAELYLTVDGRDSSDPYDWRPDQALYARYNFLYDADGGPCVQGTGQLLNGQYIYCGYNLKQTPPGTLGVGFEWQQENVLQNLRAFDTVAVCLSDTEKSVLLPKGTVIVIPDLDSFLQARSADTTLTVTDTGQGLCKGQTGDPYETLDLFVGAGKAGLQQYYDVKNEFPKTRPVDVYIQQ